MCGEEAGILLTLTSRASPLAERRRGRRLARTVPWISTRAYWLYVSRRIFGERIIWMYCERNGSYQALARD